MRARSFVLVAVAALAVGCAGREQAVRAAIARGDDYLRAGRASAAVIEYKNAIKKQPTSAEAYRKLGDAYAMQVRAEEAYRAYCSAVDLNPADGHSRVEAGRLLLSAGRFSEALVRAEQTLERDEQNVDAQVLAGRALAKMHRFDEAVAQIEAAIAIDHQPAAYAALGDARLEADDRAGAEAAFREGVSRSPQSVDAHVAFAQFLIASDRPADAEAELKRAVGADPRSEVANRALASFYVNSGRDAAAEPYLRAAAEQPNQKLRSTLALADYYLSIERYDTARRLLEPVTSGPMASDAKVRLAAVAFRTGHAADARRKLDAVMKKRPTAEAWTLDAQMLQAEKKTDAALASARAAVQMDPSAVVAQYIVGSIELERRHYAAAEDAFEVVMRNRRWTAAGSLQLARTKLAAGRASEAVMFAESAGDDFNARLTLARALVADGQEARARAELHRIEAAQPTRPEPAVLLASLALGDGDVADARAHVARALTLAPDGSDALVLAARTAIEAGDTAAGERYLTRAAAIDPSSFDAHAMLADIYVNRGDTARATATLEQYVSRHGDEAAARTALGIVLEAAKRPDKARAAYEQALAIDPAEPVASNNLARIYANDDARLQQAIELAQTAAARLPDDPDAHDTLGWIAFKTRRLSLAASELERAVALNGRNTMYQSHLREVRTAIDEAAKAAKADAARAEAEAARLRRSEQ